jgi:hypothetical protein
VKSIDRRKLLQFLALAGISKPASAFWFFGDSDKPGADPNRQIHTHRGSFTINGTTGDASSLISPGDEIITGDDSRLVFHQGKDAYLLRSHTRILLQGDNAIVNTLRIVSGAVLSVFGSGSKQIITPVATAGIRGTGTYFEVDDNQTYFCTCYGETTVSSNEDPSVTESIATTHHESPRYIRNTAQGSYIEKAPVKNHSDAELIMLEATVGREPPFGTEESEEGYYLGSNWTG